MAAGPAGRACRPNRREKSVRLTGRDTPCRGSPHPPCPPFRTLQPPSPIQPYHGPRGLRWMRRCIVSGALGRRADFRVRVTCQPGDQTQDSAALRTHSNAPFGPSHLLFFALSGKSRELGLMPR